MTRKREGRGDSVDSGPGAGGNRVHQRTECGQNLESGRGWAEAGGGSCRLR